MSTFHPFPRLPAELRIKIWSFTVEPRIVEVRVVLDRKTMGSKVISPTPVPATLQTCQEARSLGLYKREFSEISTRRNAAAGDESRYVWLNLDIDMISIGECHLGNFRHVASSIKRLRLERANSDESFYYFESQLLLDWPDMDEIHVVCKDGIEAWHRALKEHPWPCHEDNLWFFDPYDGRMLRSTETEGLLDEALRQFRVRNGWDFENFPED